MIMLEYITYKWDKLEIADNFYNKWALAMLELIATKEGWEESMDKYLKLFLSIDN